MRRQWYLHIYTYTRLCTCKGSRNFILLQHSYAYILDLHIFSIYYIAMLWFDFGTTSGHFTSHGNAYDVPTLNRQ
jgi:hypothetical protein